MNRRHTACAAIILAALGIGSTEAAGGRGSIAQADLKEWLTYIASDQLEGRAVFTEGLGLAAGYVQAHLQSWGVKPAGDNGGFIQTVKVLGVKATSRSSVTVRVGGETRTFKDREGISFPRNAGGTRTLAIDHLEFAGYGLDVPGTDYRDLESQNLEGAAVVFLGPAGPKGLDGQGYRRVLAGRSRYAIESRRAVATIGPPPAGGAGRGRGAQPEEVGGAATAGGAEQAGGAGRAGAPRGPAPANARGVNASDFTTSQRLDLPVPPALTGSDAFFEFLFSKAPVHYEELKRRAGGGEPLQGFRLDGVTLTINVDTEYSIVRTQLTQNVVGMVEGSDSQLKSTYVALGAHYDHLGYAEADVTADGRPQPLPGRVTPSAKDDHIWNGADDDGSGTVALMALARAFAQGPRPRRSMLFVWHAGEERGLYGSRYFADYPTVPIDRIVAQLNIDMIGRNRDNKDSEANTVYVVGSDRISSELHQVNREANQALRPPLTLDYEMNDMLDPEQLYYRSDHYSYAAKGIPVIFFTTGLHPDYHANTDEVSKIEFPKMTRVTELVYETAWRLGNLDHAPVRDNKGPRTGKGTP